MKDSHTWTGDSDAQRIQQAEFNSDARKREQQTE